MTPELIEKDPNPITETRKITDAALIIERTPAKPVTDTTTYIIADLKAEIAKYQAVIDVWQAKIDPLQIFVDEYNAIYLKENP